MRVEPQPLFWRLTLSSSHTRWCRFYSKESWLLVLDTRDTFFQADPFLLVRRNASYASADLVVFEENFPLKTIGTCPFNSGWLSCFGLPKGADIVTWRGIHNRPTPLVKANAHKPVRCSGSTLGTRSGLEAYVDAMLAAFDRFACHRSELDPIQSDQGYHNYLLLSGALERADESTGRRALRVRSEPMGHGLVNTIGTLHVNRLQGKLADEDKFKQLAQWGLRDEAQGFVTNFDGMRSAIVHQWDRQFKELEGFVRRAFVTDSFHYDPSCVDRPWKNSFGKTCVDLGKGQENRVSTDGIAAGVACCVLGGGDQRSRG